MGLRAERLFQKLHTLEALRELIGTSESSELECKQWSTPDANRGTLAKAACGLANAEGGVIIIGMRARGRANEPDLIQGFEFVSDVHGVALMAREMIVDALEPGIRDIKVVEVDEHEGEASGCVVVYVAEEDGTPQRVRRGGQFYVRMATATLPMLYSQIADRFGRRPHARLLIEPTELTYIAPNYSNQGARSLGLFVENIGRGSARFPAIRCLKGGGFHHYPGPYNTNVPRWAFLDDMTEWFSYRGSADDVLHPGEKIAVAWLAQMGEPVGAPDTDLYNRQLPAKHLHFASVTLETRVVCEGMPEYAQLFEWGEFWSNAKKP